VVVRQGGRRRHRDHGAGFELRQLRGSEGHAVGVVCGAAADLNSTVDIAYDIRGTADHTHSVTFTAAQLAQLKAGTMVTVTTTTTLTHNHVIGELCT
jgi:hypothetical protein